MRVVVVVRHYQPYCLSPSLSCLVFNFFGVGEAGFDSPAKLAGWLHTEVPPLPGFPLSFGFAPPTLRLGPIG